MLWETGLADIMQNEALHCDAVTNSSCYYAKTVPVIFDISAKEGYRTGG